MGWGWRIELENWRSIYRWLHLLRCALTWALMGLSVHTCITIIIIIMVLEEPLDLCIHS